MNFCLLLFPSDRTLPSIILLVFFVVKLHLLFAFAPVHLTLTSLMSCRLEYGYFLASIAFGYIDLKLLFAGKHLIVCLPLAFTSRDKLVGYFVEIRNLV